MEGRSAAGVLAVTLIGCPGKAVAQGAKRRWEAGNEVGNNAAAKRQRDEGFEVVVEAAMVAQREVADASKTKRWREEEAEVVGVTKRRRAETTMRGKKRKRGEAEGRASQTGGGGGGGGGTQLLEQVSMVQVRPTMAAAAPSPPPTQIIQQLVDFCKSAFDGSSSPPSPAIVAFIRGLMDKITPNDVVLRDELRFFHMMNNSNHPSLPIITCKTLYECHNFTVAVFFLPPGAEMTLHDHPGMTVFSKLVVGSAHVTSYDWIHPRISVPLGSDYCRPMMLAKKVLDHDVMAPACSSWVLFPDAGGNLHRFVAGRDTYCAFLDVLTPPYSLPDQRICGFYQDFPYHIYPNIVGSYLTDEEKSQLAWLRKIEEPKYLKVSPLPYQGPTII
ncbi:hypothetical protein ACP4OV_008649 [Aristida adscensionis]